MAFQWIMSGCLAQTREGLGYHVQEEGEECCCWSRANVGAWGRTGCVCYEWNVVVSSLKVRLSFFSCSVVSNSVTPWTAARQASLFFTISWSFLKLMLIESVMPPNHLILCRPLLLLPSVFPSIRVFSSESALHIRWPKYWSFRFSISPSNEYSGLISFRIDWFDLAVQGTLKSLLQHHSYKESNLRCLVFFSEGLSLIQLGGFSANK